MADEATSSKIGFSAAISGVVCGIIGDVEDAGFVFRIDRGLAHGRTIT